MDYFTEYDTEPEWIEPESGYDYCQVCNSHFVDHCECRDIAEMDEEQFEQVARELNEDYYQEFPEFYGYDAGEPIEFGYNEEW